MSEFASVTIAICVAVTVVALILIAFPVWLFHRRELIKLQSGNPNTERVLSRLDALEARCKSIEDKLNQR